MPGGRTASTLNSTSVLERPDDVVVNALQLVTPVVGGHGRYHDELRGPLGHQRLEPRPQLAVAAGHHYMRRIDLGTACRDRGEDRRSRVLLAPGHVRNQRSVVVL